MLAIRNILNKFDGIVAYFKESFEQIDLTHLNQAFVN